MSKYSKGSLGQRARDVVTGFEGRIMAVCHYWTGCDEIMLTPDAGPSDEPTTERPKSEWFDDVRLEPLAGAKLRLPGSNEAADAN